MAGASSTPAGSGARARGVERRPHGAPAVAAARARRRRRTRGWPPWRSPPRPRAARAAGARCGRPTAARRRLHAPAADAPPARATSSAPGSADQPRAQPAALEREAGARVQLARLVAEQVAEQAERRRSGPSAARGRGRMTFAPRRAYSTGMSQACASATSETGNDERLQRHHHDRDGDERDVWATVVSVHTRPRRRSRAASSRGRQ